ncbi:hypothetical protein ACFWDN_21340 [Micromonospora chalcea]
MPESADHLLSVIDEDFDALASADLVVLLPGASALWETAVAAALGKPLIAFADLTTEARIA